MGPLTAGLLMIVLLLVLLSIGLPIAFSLGVSGVICIYMVTGWDTTYGFISTTPFNTSASWLYVVLPLFVLMGMLAYSAGINEDAFTIANNWLGRIKGGLAMATIVACSIFGATSGSSIAAAATMGKLAIPEMRRFGYSMKLAAGSVAGGGTLSVMIPPSGILVIYGIITEESIGKLLIAGLAPGLLSALIYMVGIYLLCAIRPEMAPSAKVKVSWSVRFGSLKNGYGATLIFGIVMGGIYTGIFTPTEAGAFGAAVALVLVLMKSKTRFQSLREGLTETAKVTCMFFTIVICAHFFTLGLTVSSIPKVLVTYLVGLSMHPKLILIILLFVYLPLGMFLDTVSMLFLTLPIIFPVVKALGFSGIWFGILVTKLIEVSLITPPVGLNVYVIKGILPEVEIGTIFRGVIPFLIMDILTLMILFIFPQITLWLPSTMH
ncbi:MAG: TRAP transporter large permease [Deltaproteobacteria bacterium]|nr:TRAP transporter large permease [Deltaproteobacteria bacterium]